MTHTKEPTQSSGIIINDQPFWQQLEQNAKISQEHLIRTIDGEKELQKFKQKQADTQTT